MKKCLSLLLSISVFCFAENASAAPPAFELKSGDRIVFLGNTLIERSQKFGRWESVLMRSFPKAKLSFRNLGWSADTVWSESRGIFDPPAVGYQRMLKQVKDLKPQVIFVGYGGNEAFAGKKGLPAFEKQMETLLTDLKPTGAKIVILSPHRFENAGHPLPDPQSHNKDLKLYSDCLQEIALRGNHNYVDLFTRLIPDPAGTPELKWTTNGIHLTESGYQRAAGMIAADLGLQPVTLSPENEQKIRQLTCEKNRHYFYNWRPQNITYLLGFRKHEQGQNAKELPQYIPLINAKETEIHRLISSQ